MNSIFDINLLLQLGPQKKEIKISSSKSRLGIMGPSGCGKTSLARSIVGIHPVIQGYIKIKNKNLYASSSETNLHPWDRKIGYVPQDLQLLPHLNVQRNILFPVGGKIHQDLIEGFGISHLLDRMPRNLSGGEKQRVAIIRAISSSPELLILDEPFSSLDTHMKQQSIQFLHKFLLTHEIPVLVISHGKEDLEALDCEVHTLSGT